MPVPYLGSKRAIAGTIYQTIRNLNPDANILVDLFCGGFAVGEYFLENGWSVIANDKNKYVVALLEKTIFDGLPEGLEKEFITREKFYGVLNNRDKYDDWYVGYVMCIWSYGNNQKDYLFSEDNEKNKKALHEFVVNQKKEELKTFFPLFFEKALEKISELDDWHKRRIATSKLLVKLEKFRKREFRLQLEGFQLQHLEMLQRLERLQHLERLRRLQHSEKSQWLHFFSLDYKDVFIPKDAIVYCDPPYEGVEEYDEGGFDHREFWDYVRKLSETNKVYISEYHAPEDFRVVLRVPKKSTYGGGQNRNQPDECLFTISR